MFNFILLFIYYKLFNLFKKISLFRFKAKILETEQNEWRFKINSYDSYLTGEKCHGDNNFKYAELDSIIESCIFSLKEMTKCIQKLLLLETVMH